MPGIGAGGTRTVRGAVDLGRDFLALGRARMENPAPGVHSGSVRSGIRRPGRLSSRPLYTGENSFTFRKGVKPINMELMTLTCSYRARHGCIPPLTGLLSGQRESLLLLCNSGDPAPRPGWGGWSEALEAPGWSGAWPGTAHQATIPPIRPSVLPLSRIRDSGAIL